MEDDGPPYRTPSGPKPEQIIQFYDSCGEGGEVVDSCVKKANIWLRVWNGRIDIILREIAIDDRNLFSGILIWYREKEE